MAEGPEYTSADVSAAVRIGAEAGRMAGRREAVTDVRTVVLEEFAAFFDSVRDQLDALEKAYGVLPADDGHDVGWNTAGDEPRCSRMGTP